MSDARTVEAITHAIEAAAKSNLALVDELTQSRVIQQRMANTLIEIHSGQQQLIEQMGKLVERQNDHSKRQSDSESRIRVLESRHDRHVEQTEKRLERLERAAPKHLTTAK